MDLIIEASLPPSRFPGMSTLLSRGFYFPVTPGATIRDVLETQAGICPEYVQNRIQTVFLNGKAVDDMGAARVSDGDTLSVSAAMPGLAGATFRKGGFYSTFRAGISYHERPDIHWRQTGSIFIKLFNFIAREIGPAFLSKGIRLMENDFTFFLEETGPDVVAAVSRVRLNGIPVTWETLFQREKRSEIVLLKILFPDS